MDRTTGADWVDIGSGKRGFRSQNRSAGIVGTEVNGAHMNAVQEEIMAVIEAAGLLPEANDWTQLLQAIGTMIEDVRVLQPIYPDVVTTDGKFTVTSPSAGTVRVAAGTQWVMRGGKSYVSALTNLPTAASKVYHLRWSLAGSWSLKDLASSTYNPAALAEDHVSFDSSYDDMLVARVVTNGGNVATITTLANKPRLRIQTERRDVLLSQLNWASLAGTSTALNWARTPDVVYFAMNEWRSNNAGPDGSTTSPSAGTARAVGGRVPVAGRTRYGLPALDYYYEDDNLTHGIASWTLLVMAP